MKDKRGVVHWLVGKKRDLERLANGGTKQHVIATIWGGKNYPKHIDNMWHKFGNHPPTDEHFLQLFEKIARFINPKRPELTASDMIHCTQQEFRRMMSAENRAMIRRIEGTKEHIQFLVDLDAHRLDVHKDWLDKGVVDQRYMYSDRYAVEGWKNVVDSGGYHQFKHCRQVLDEFLAGDIWTEALEKQEIGSVVILGAGAWQKDVEILNSILDHEAYKTTPFKFIVFDSSFYMLADTITAIERVLDTRRVRDRIDLIPCCADFMRLAAWQDIIEPLEEEKRIAVFILGGTIGNLDDAVLFHAVSNTTKEGDLFVVSGEFVPETEVDVFRKLFENEYDGDSTRDSTRNFALGPVHHLLDEKRHSREPDVRRGYVEVKFLDDASHLPARARSLLPGTLAAVFRLKIAIEGVKLILIVAKRYLEKAIVASATSLGFECVETHHGRGKARYHRYLVFRKTAG
ncbi:MAG TPA: L-histidine N(alpha)-methyltransferase [Rhizomicrobium sp.]|jgi:hypothetical protein|nr:L-histidine N(alpha)-methyltransferase [Rhizomicrobium sp.]